MEKFSSLSLLLALLLCDMSSSALAQSKVIIAIPFEDSVLLSFAEALESHINEIPEDAFKVEVYPNGILGNWSDLYEQVAAGSVDIALLPPLSPYFTTGLAAPFTFSNLDAAIPYFQSFEPIESKFGIAFAVIPRDVAVLVGSESIYPDDLSNLNILTRRNDLADTYRVYRHTDHSLAQLLSEGVSKGSAAEGFLLRLGPPQRNSTVTRFDHRFLVGVVFVGRKFYRKLPEWQQQALTDAISQASSDALVNFKNSIPGEFNRLLELGWNVTDQTKTTYRSDELRTGGDNCTADEYLRKYEDACRCESGDKDDEC